MYLYHKVHGYIIGDYSQKVEMIVMIFRKGCTIRTEYSHESVYGISSKLDKVFLDYSLNITWNHKISYLQSNSISYLHNVNTWSEILSYYDV